jgi:hypothetical protein
LEEVIDELHKLMLQNYDDPSAENFLHAQNTISDILGFVFNSMLFEEFSET